MSNYDLTALKQNYENSLDSAKQIAEKYKLSKQSNDCASLMQLVKDFVVKVPIMGTFNAGKSSLLNAYLNSEYLPVAITPETALACEIVYDTKEYLEVISDNATIKEMSVQDLRNLTIDNCKYVRLHTSNKKIHDLVDVVLVDMPGLDSDHKQHNQAISSYLNMTSFFIVLSDAEQGTVKDSVLSFFEDNKLFDFDFVFLISKKDAVTDENLKKIEATVKQTIQDHTGKDVFVGKISSDAHDITDFDTVLKNLDVVKVTKKCLTAKIITLLKESILTELDRKIKYDTFDETEIDNQIKGLEKKIQETSKNIAKETQLLKSKCYMVVDSILTDVSTSLSQNVDTLISHAKAGDNSLGNVINQLVRPVITASSEKYLMQLFTETNANLQVALAQNLGDLFVSHVATEDIELFNKQVDTTMNALLGLAVKFLPTAKIAGITSAVTLTGTAAFTAVTLANVALPIVGSLIVVALPLIAKFFKNNKEAEQASKVKRHWLTVVIPQMLDQIKAQLSASIANQTGAFISAIDEKFAEETKSIQENLEQAKAQKQKSAGEARIILQVMQADRQIVQNIIQELQN